MKLRIGAALALLCALQLLAILRAPAAFHPAQIRLALAPSQAIDIGRRELAAPQASQRQLSIRRDAGGQWWLRNLSASRSLTLTTQDGKRRTGSTAMRAGQQIRIGSMLYIVDAADGASLTLRSGGQQWHYDGATVRRKGEAQPPCLDAPLGVRALAMFNRALPAALTIARPLAFGGNLHCGNRIGIPYTTPASASIKRLDGRFELSASEHAMVLVDGGDLAHADMRLAGVSAIALGRTRYAVRIDKAGLALVPQQHVALYTEPDQPLPDGISWDWTGRSAWHLPGAASASILLVLACAAALAARRYPAAIPLSAAIAGVAALLMQRAGAPPGVGVSMLLAWAALWSFLLLPGRFNLAGAAGILLLALGLLSQLELGLGTMASSATKHFQNGAALLAIGLGMGSGVRLRSARALTSQRQIEFTLAALAFGALAALILQVLYGDETGVFGLQPVELAKVALTLLSAHCIAIGLGWKTGLPEQHGALVRWFRLGAPALLFAALLAFALIEVDDYSPLLLLLVWSMAMTMAWALVARRPLVAGSIIGTALLAAGAIAFLRSAGVHEVAEWGFYADRFLVWLDPASHPHTGQQLLLAARAIAEGSWFGADQLFGLTTLGQHGGSALRIPAIQDDFAPSFFLNRHGLAGALALWGLQALFLAGLLQTAAACCAGAAGARDFRLAYLGRFRCFALCGGAAFVLGHLLLSWGTNLAIFPIMGQPMSFLSAGGSHLLFFICPLLTLSAVSAQSPDQFDNQRRIDHAGLRPT